MTKEPSDSISMPCRCAVQGRCRWGAGAVQVACRSGAAAMQVGCRYPYAPRLRPHAPRRQRSASRQPAAARVMCRALSRPLAALRVRPHGQTAMRPCYRATYCLLPTPSLACTENAHPIALLRYHALVSAYATERPTQPPKRATSSRLNLKLIGSLACHGGARAVRVPGARAVRVPCVCAAGPQCGAVSHTPPASARTDS